MDGNTATIVQQVLDWLTNVGKFVAENSWRIAMRQVYVYGGMDVLVGVLLSVGGFISLKLGLKTAKENGWDDGNYTDNVPAYLGVILGSFAIAIGIGVLVASIRFFVNPEWYAIQLIVNQVK